MPQITPEMLGNKEFKADYHIRYAYLTGAMYRGIASKEVVVKMGKAGLMGFLGTAGLSLSRIESDIQFIQSNLNNNESYGMNILCNIIKPKLEEETVELYFRLGVNRIEAAAYMQITPALVLFRLKGLTRDAQGQIVVPHTVVGKISRPEVATVFMSPAPEKIVQKLVAEGRLTEEEANLGKEIPMAHDICVESDSGGHTDQRIALTLFPSIMRLRDEMMAQHHYTKAIRVGAAGGIGTPEAAAAAFIMGADFILTGSINQCTVESGTSDVAKDLLQDINIQDTAYAPAGDMFELGARIQVLRKGVLFPARANKLYDLYTHYNSLDEIDAKTKEQVEQRYFMKTFDQVWNETREFFLKEKPDEVEKAEKNPKHKMALVFRWYFGLTTRIAMDGSEPKADYQVHCGSALGSFNQWVKGTPLENWRNRHVDEIANMMMNGAAEVLNKRYEGFLSK